MDAYAQGYKAYYNAVSIMNVPFSRSAEPEDYDDWRSGWRMAESDQEVRCGRLSAD